MCCAKNSAKFDYRLEEKKEVGRRGGGETEETAMSSGERRMKNGQTARVCAVRCVEAS